MEDDTISYTEAMCLIHARYPTIQDKLQAHKQYNDNENGIGKTMMKIAMLTQIYLGIGKPEHLAEEIRNRWTEMCESLHNE